MKDRKHNIFYGIEIETESDYSMPERVMVYDICEYEYQIKELHKEHIDRKDYKNYREKKSRMKESDILLPTITVHLNVKELIHKMDKEELPMCRAFEELMEEKRQEGKIKGISEGKREEKVIIIKRMIKDGLDEALISKVTRCTKEEYAIAAGR